MKPIEVEGFGGEMYAASSSRELVEQMRDASFGGDQSDGVKGYMKQIAKRVKDWSGHAVRTERPEEFLEDLARAGVIRIVKPEGKGK